MKVFCSPDDVIVNTSVEQEIFSFLAQGWEEIPVDIFKGLERFANSSNTTKLEGLWTFSLDAEKLGLNCKSRMKRIKDEHCCSGLIVTTTVATVEYSGLFYPFDDCLRAAAGVSTFRDTVDNAVSPVKCGPIWYTKDEAGQPVEIPITEALIGKIGAEVENWGADCTRVYQERKKYMLSLTPEELETFDPVADMEAHLPSRNLTI